MKIPLSEISQYYKPYFSTLSFEKFIQNNIFNSKKIIDLGCGTGGQLSYFSKRHPDVNFVGTDYNKHLIKFAKKTYSKLKINNTKFFFTNILDKKINPQLLNADGFISNHVFCTFKDIKYPLNFIFKHNPKWVAINSLFYNGPLDVLTHIRSYKKNKSIIKDSNPDGDFNIFSIPILKEIIKNKYKIVKIEQHFPKKKIKKISNKRSSYTIMTEINKNTVFSGPVYLPWHFILLEKLTNDKK
jgi:SAM-dependent methyltransferase